LQPDCTSELFVSGLTDAYQAEHAVKTLLLIMRLLFYGYQIRNVREQHHHQQGLLSAE